MNPQEEFRETGGNQKEVRATVLDDGDTLFVPKKNFIQVLGEVNVPNVINYSDNLSADDYIALAGGLTKELTLAFT